MNLFKVFPLTLLLVSTLFLCSCGNESDTPKEVVIPDKQTVSSNDTADKGTKGVPAVYANARFRKVKVEKQSLNAYVVTGEAQVFEAAFSWIVEDGHTELLEGHETTTAGAPAWGSFRFVIAPKASRSNSMLTLVLFEYSAKDGSRQHRLAVQLPQ